MNYFVRKYFVPTNVVLQRYLNYKSDTLLLFWLLANVLIWQLNRVFECYYIKAKRNQMAEVRRDIRTQNCKSCKFLITIYKNFLKNFPSCMYI
jgi:ABC-type uncharacterized transport system permease subunit